MPFAKYSEYCIMRDMKVNHVHFATIESTNRWAMEHAATFNPLVLTVITASEQTAGYGRLGRSWLSPANENLYATFCLSLPLTCKDYSLLTFVMALAAAELLKENGLSAHIKWPNDLMINEKKIAGILCESKVINDERFLALGIGLNVNITAETLKALQRPATSMSVETNQRFDLNLLLELLTHHFLSHLEIFLTKGFVPFVIAIRCYMQIGQFIRFSHGNHLFEGTIQQFNDDGSLCLLLSDGSERLFFSGEILY